MSCDHALRVIIIGHWPKEVSGSALMVSNLVRTLNDRSDVQIQFIDTARKNTRNSVLNLFTAMMVSSALLFSIKRRAM